MNIICLFLTFFIAGRISFFIMYRLDFILTCLILNLNFVSIRIKQESGIIDGI